MGNNKELFHMAIVLEEKEISIEWTDIDRMHIHVPPYGVRSSGTHVTDILRYLHFGSLPLETDEYKQKQLEWDLDDRDIMPLRMFMGMGWEMWAARLYPELEWQPGEVEIAGIAGSPDGFSILPIAGETHVVVEEFKLTWKSCRHREILKERLWMWQIKSYVWMSGSAMEGPGYARVHVCWVNGDYERPFSPKYIRYLIQFDEEELDRNWVMVRDNAQRAVEWNRERARS